jgi:hypothetical protein
MQGSAESIITYEELFAWRNVCELLHRLGAIDRGRWTEFGLSEWDCAVFIKDARLVLSFDVRPRRQLLWDTWRIQLVRWISSSQVAKKNTGWVLKSRWEHKIDFLEHVVLFNASPYSLPMPWLRSDMPKPWDAVISKDLMPRPGDMVLSRKPQA